MRHSQDSSPFSSVRQAFRAMAVFAGMLLCAGAWGADAGGGASSAPAGGAGRKAVKHGVGGANAVAVAETAWLGESGEPQVAWRVFRFLLPPDADLQQLVPRLEPSAYETIPGIGDVSPVPPVAAADGAPVWPVGRHIRDGRDTDIYGKDAFWPENPVRLLSSGRLHQFKLVEIGVPVSRYNPVSRTRQRLLDNASVTLEYASDGGVPKGQGVRRGSRLYQEANRRLQLLVANAGDVSAYDSSSGAQASGSGPSMAPAAGGTGYVIVIPSALKNASTEFNNFVAHKQARGFTVTVVTEAEWGGGSGQEIANNVRAWLQNNYANLGVLYVLLIGDPRPDVGNLPMKLCINDHPTDYYFAELTGNWDANANGVYGEDADAPEKIFEVYTGRIPNYGSAADLDSILQKTIAYENAADITWRRNVLLPEVPLDASTPGYQLGEQIKYNQLESRGIPSDRIYDSDYGALPPPEFLRGNMYPATRWAAMDYGFVFWNTHGWAKGASGIIASEDAANLDNAHPSVIFQGSCDTGYPEYTDNLGYSILKNGGVATVAASRNGWYYVGQSDFTWSSSVGGLVYAYARHLMNGECVGQAVFGSKEELGFWLKNYYVYNLYGDPSLQPLTAGTLASISATPTTAAITAPKGGIPELNSKTFTLTNNTSGQISWTATENSAWLATPSPANGTLAAGASVVVTVSLDAAYQAQPVGLSQAPLTFTDTTNGTSFARTVTLKVFDTGLRGWWKLDDAAGTTALDSSGNAKHGSLPSGGTWTAGQFSGGLDFNGSSNYVAIPALNLNAVSTTITGWVKRSGAQGDYSGLVFSRAGATCAGLSLRSGGELRYHWNGAASSYNFASGLVVPDGVWTFVALVVEPTKATIYMHDGTSLRSAVNNVAHTQEEFNGELRLGNDSSSTSRTLKGTLDEVRIYNEALTPAAIANLAIGLGAACNPQPAHLAVNQPNVQLPMSWTGTPGAVSHHLYIGSSAAAVAAATPVSPEFRTSLTSTSYTLPETIAGGTTYWRVDEVNGASVVAGPVWSFQSAPVDGLAVEYWDGIGSGTAVTDLTGNAAYPDSPTATTYLSNLFELPANRADSYGARVRALLRVPATGNYTFWIASDDASELWLSTDTTPANKAKIAYVSSYTSARTWTTYASQQSATIALTAGQCYYIEALFKEGGGGDHLAVAWQGPGISQQVIPGYALEPYVPAATAHRPGFGLDPIVKAILANVPCAETLAGTAADADAGEALSYSKVSGPTWLNVAADGTLSGTPLTSDGGENTFTVRVTDAAGHADDTTLNITVVLLDNGVWINVAGGSWPTTTNWQNGIVAYGISGLADFSTLNLTADATVTLDGARTLGSLVFGDTTPSHNWILAPGTGGALTLDVLSGTPAITVNNQTATLSAILAGSKGLTKNGTGTLLLSGANTYTGVTTVAAGVLKLGNAAALGSTSGGTVVNGGSLDLNGQALGAVAETVTISGTNALVNGVATEGSLQNVALAGDATISNANTICLGTGATGSSGSLALNGYTLTKSGTGTLVLNGLSLSGAGNITVSQGTLQLIRDYSNNQQNLSLAGTGTLTINAGATVSTRRWGSGLTLSMPIVMNGGTLGSSWPGPNGATIASPITLNANSVFNFGGGYANVIISGNISGTGGLTRSGSETTIFTGTNTYSGPTVVNAALQIGNGGTTGTLGTGNVTNSSSLVFKRSNALTVANIISGTGSLTQSGTGTLTLSGINTYTGATNVNTGTLQLTGSLANTATTVASGATLSGTGSIAGTVTVNGILAPGVDGLGTLTATKTLAFGATGTAAMQINKTGTTLTADKVQGIATLTCGGTLTVTATGDALAAGDSFTLFSATSYAGAFATVNLPALTGGLVWNTANLAIDGTISVAKGSQTISFGSLAAKTYGDAPFALTATASSGLAVTYASSNPAVATVEGDTVTIVGAGTATITASQAGDATYQAAADVPQALMINPASQTISFDALAAKTYGDAPFALTATASSGLAVSYASSNPAVATVAGSTLTIVGAGTATITASQAGDANYSAAADIPQALVVGQASQTISFDALAAKTYGDAPFALTATASSGLPVSYASSNPAVATVAGSTLTIVGAGTATITASQAGDANYSAAADVPQALVVNKASQTITFGALATQSYGDAPFALTAASSSGLAVSYASSNPAVATVAGNTVTIVGAGTTTITASQAGDANYSAATDVQQPLTVNPGFGNGVWTNLSGGSWIGGQNWLNSTIGDGIGNTADFSTLNLTADATVTLDGARTIGSLVFGDTTPSHNWILNTGTGDPLTLNVNAGTPTITVNNQTTTIGAVIAGTKGVAKEGAGLLILSGNKNFSGGVKVNAGMLRINAGGWYINPFGSSNQVTINNGATLVTNGAHSLGVDANPIHVNGGTLQLGAENYISSLQMTGGLVTGGELRTWGGTMTFNASAAGATIASKFNLVGTATLNVADGAAADDLTISNVIYNANGLTKSGLGKLVLSGASTYTGATNVNAGTLQLTGSLATTATTVASGATLAGTGSTAGTVTVNGTLAPGIDGIGTLTVNNTLSLGSTATAAMQINKTGTTLTADKVQGITTLTCGGTLTVTAAGDALAAGDSFTLFSATSYAGSFATVNLPALSGNLIWETANLTVNGTISVLSVNQAPSALPQTVSTAEDTAAAVTLSGSDPESQPLSYAVVTEPAHGTLSGTAPNLTYTPAADWSGSDSFTFKVWDGALDSAPATVTLSVSTVNDAPTAYSNAASTDEDTPVGVVLAGSDPEQSPLSYAVVTEPAHGTLSGTAPNLTYTPAANWSGTDSFTFKVNDGALDSAPEAVLLTVSPVNDAPAFTASPVVEAAALAGSAYTGETLADNAGDVDAGDLLSFAKLSGPSWLSIAVDGTLSGTPAASDWGSNSFVVRATDNHGATADATMTVVVQVTVTLLGTGAYDGYVLESGENTNAGGNTFSATASTGTALMVGDSNKKYQYKSVVSFATGGLPSGATVTSATLRLLRGGGTGTNPFTTHGTCWVDLKGGSGFGGALALARSDFEAAADVAQVAAMSNPASVGTWSTGSLNAAGIAGINRAGETQMKLYFSLDDDNDSTSDYVGFYSGENATSANRPQFVLVYE